MDELIAPSSDRPPWTGEDFYANFAAERWEGLNREQRMENLREARDIV